MASKSDQWTLGLSTGRTFIPTLQSLRELDGIEWSRIRFVLPDAYCHRVASAYGLYPPSQHLSPVHFMREHLFDAVRQNHGYAFSAAQVWIPDPNDLNGSEAELTSWGIDLMLLASGSGDGHVAFNTPGTPLTSRTSIVTLPESTKADNLATYPAFASTHEVPSLGVTIGISTIIDVSREAVLVAAGRDKARALARILDSDTYVASWPATVIHCCRFARLLTDIDAIEYAKAVPQQT